MLEKSLSETKTTFQVRIAKIINFKRHSETETKNLFVKERSVFRSFQLAAV